MLQYFSFITEKGGSAVNYNGIMEDTVASLNGVRPELVLHSCCAVCLSSVIERLNPHFKITVLCCNPNIYPAEEYYKRRDEQIRFLSMIDTDAVFDEIAYDHDEYLNFVNGLEDEPEGGARCEKCFRMRLNATARYTKEHGIDYMCSTLTISPHKNSSIVNLCGAEAAEKEGLHWLYSDFKKKDGFLRSNRLAAQYEIYRQKYCGCEFTPVSPVIDHEE